MMAIDVSTELAVMQSVGNALAQLPDARSRARVLRWAAHHVRSAERAETADLFESTIRPASDPIVSVVGLVELFSDLGGSDRQDLDGLEFGSPCGDDVDDGESLDTLIRGLAEELGQFAIDWQHA